MEIEIMFLSILSVIHGVTQNGTIYVNRLYCFLIIWIGYIVLHSCTMYVMEEYRTYYLAITLFSILPLSYFLQVGLLTRSNVENGLIIIVVIHLAYIVGQSTGLMVSGNKYFSITGSNENPTITAVYLVCCIPLLVQRIYVNKHRWPLITLLIISLLSVGILKCRTAYIGLFTEFVIFLFMYLRKSRYNFKKQHLYNKYIFFTVVIVALGFLSIKMYKMKLDSANSRMLIWKISTEMIADKPQGYGYGLFERNYNLCQSDYFRSGEATNYERQTAAFTAMAYNDYLEQGVEGGVVGMLFLCVFYALLIMKAFYRRDTNVLCTISGIVIMSLTNFVYSSMQPWWLLMCYASFLASDNKSVKIKKIYLASVGLIVFCLLFVGIIRIQNMLISQITLNTYYKNINKGKLATKKQLLALQPYIGTSEAYWNLCAYNSILGGKYNNAITYINKARLFTSNLQEYEMLFWAYQQLQKVDEGIGYIETLHYIQPSLLRPQSILMDYYDRIGETRKALRYAHDIISTTPKVNSEESAMIQYKASCYLEKNRK